MGRGYAAALYSLMTRRGRSIGCSRRAWRDASATRRIARQVLVEVAPKLQEMAEQLYGPPRQAAAGPLRLHQRAVRASDRLPPRQRRLPRDADARLDALPVPEAQAPEAPTEL